MDASRQKCAEKWPGPFVTVLNVVFLFRNFEDFSFVTCLNGLHHRYLHWNAFRNRWLALRYMLIVEIFEHT